MFVLELNLVIIRLLLGSMMYLLGLEFRGDEFIFCYVNVGEGFLFLVYCSLINVFEVIGSFLVCVWIINGIRY